MIGTWAAGLIRRRGARLVAIAGGVALAVALLAALGSFLSGAQASMTARAVRGVTIDWQVAGANTADLQKALQNTPGVRRTEPVGYASTSGLVATTTATAGATTQTTGPGKVLGIPAGYPSAFPGSVRVLAGTDHGVLVAQQTAANLHVAPGDTVLIGRTGLAPVSVVVTGIVDLPHADTMFQNVGAPPSAQPKAPPDNIVLLDQPLWHTTFDPLAAARPDLVHSQVHVALGHQLPSAPADAYTSVTAAANHFEAATSGAGVVGNNLAAALDAARADAAYAQILFLFLATPAAVLAGLLTATVVSTGAVRRRREHALLRARGATAGNLLSLAAVEAVLTGVAGAAVGLGAAVLIDHLAFGTAASLSWSVAAAVVGLAIAAATVLIPAWRDLRVSTVASGRILQRTTRGPLWSRYGLDLILLAAGGIVFWSTSRGGYQLVLAPEGAPTISVSYWAFAGPALLWTGAALLAWRLTDLALGRGRGLLRHVLRPLAGGLSGTVANSLSRQRSLLARAIVLLGLALAFAASTATFNATYRTQAEVDAQLTNGADVTVTPSPGAETPPSDANRLAKVPGVHAVEPVQHRYAYVGTDLQDLYGVRPSSITGVTALQDSFFQGGTARQLMDRLAAQPDSVLVSAETVKDFQLHPGDQLNLRLQNGRTKQLVTVPFHYAGVVSEFPTAPSDSFLVANSTYVAKMTGSSTVGAFLVDTNGANSTAVAEGIRNLLGPSATVTDLAHTRTTIGSSLTAVDLAGLSQVELGFGLVLAAAAGALVLALGLAERRRSFAIAAALGATPRQLRAFVTGETAVLTAGGLISGALTGWLLSQVLVKVLTGVFDPPPTAPTTPWPYLAAVTLTLLAALAAVTAATIRLARRPPLRVLREL
ncbi:ABC transporter permease [Actinophytocola sp.]|uniref:ABC transporter permease n=1 Tax=Actinophytocola sp. TaxID=1872138 RepID=UPI002EDA498F